MKELLLQAISQFNLIFGRNPSIAEATCLKNQITNALDPVLTPSGIVVNKFEKPEKSASPLKEEGDNKNGSENSKSKLEESKNSSDDEQPLHMLSSSDSEEEDSF